MSCIVEGLDILYILVLKNKFIANLCKKYLDK